MLYILPAPIFERNLLEILHYVKNVLGWAKFEPILEYIYERYPSSGSLFNVQVVKEAINVYVLSLVERRDSVSTYNIVEERQVPKIIFLYFFNGS